MSNAIVLIGAGQIGQAIARRVGVGNHVVLADRSEASANAAAEVMGNAGYEVSVATVDVSSRESMSICTALLWCLKNSGTLLRRVGPALSSRHSQGIGSPR